jgi:hypothetical protein
VTRTDIDVFEKLDAQLTGLHSEMSTLTKKAPNDAVNIFKMALVNAALTECNVLLGKEYRPFQDFETFSVDDLPTNSDVSLIISQYLTCLEKLRADNVAQIHGRWVWTVEDTNEEIRTAPPRKISEKK